MLICNGYRPPDSPSAWMDSLEQIFAVAVLMWCAGILIMPSHMHLHALVMFRFWQTYVFSSFTFFQFGGSTNTSLEAL